jgi:hypothetical protein
MCAGFAPASGGARALRNLSRATRARRLRAREDMSGLIHTLTPVQRSIITTTIMVVLFALLLWRLMPMMNGRELYFMTFASSPFPTW